MKVLFITNYPVPYRVDFFNELGSLCELTVLFEQRSDEVSDRDQTGITEEFKNFKGVYFDGLRVHIGCYYFNLKAVTWVRKMRQYDAVIFGIYSTPTQALMILLSKLIRRKYVLNSDGGFVKDDHFLAGKLKRFLISDAALYLASGRGTKQYLEYYGANPERVRIYPFSSLKQKDLMTEAISPETKAKLRKKYGINESRVVIGVGQFIERKGWDVLLEAARFVSPDVGI
ncbi:MAG: hypothetical protein K6A68_08570 [Clostridiales bacterium]|nr:hypothetical protein [Clostridiales bacterium]